MDDILVHRRKYFALACIIQAALVQYDVDLGPGMWLWLAAIWTMLFAMMIPSQTVSNVKLPLGFEVVQK